MRTGTPKPGTGKKWDSKLRLCVLVLVGYDEDGLESCVEWQKGRMKGLMKVFSDGLSIIKD